jgi:hypothetical protein
LISEKNLSREILNDPKLYPSAYENYKDNISQVWTESMLSLDIQKEFQANALCFESRSYKAFTLI